MAQDRKESEKELFVKRLHREIRDSAEANEPSDIGDSQKAADGSPQDSKQQANDSFEDRLKRKMRSAKD